MNTRRPAEKQCFRIPVRSLADNLTVTIRSRAEFLKLQIPVSTPDEADFTAQYTLPFPADQCTLEAPEEFFAVLEWHDALPVLPPPAPQTRQQIHFSPRQGWMNDPNGLHFRGGTWHMFLQYNPFSAKWNNMHWLHAESRDLIHWRETGIALYPDHLGVIYSGSAVIDHNNVSGLGAPGTSPLLLFYTNAHYAGAASQHLAFSADGAESFSRYSGNPILPNSNGKEERDPQVAFDPDAGVWRMALYSGEETSREFRLLSSDDLRSWRETDRYTIAGGRECPGILPLIDRGDGKRKWLFTEANCLYRIGEISREGKIHFHSESRPFYFGRSNNAYAGQFFHDAPDGRAIFIAWQRMPFAEGSAVTGSMTLPVEVTLRNNTLRLTPAVQLPGTPCGAIPAIPYSAEIAAAAESIAAIRFGERSVLVDSARREVSIDGEIYRFPEEMTRLEGTLFVDRRSIEFHDHSGTFNLALGATPQEECVLERFQLRNIRKLHAVTSI